MHLTTASRCRSVLLAAVLTLLASAPAFAQTRPEVIRGTVTGQDGTLIRGAVVAVTRAPDRLTLSTQTDSTGAYSVSFAEGTGDYLVHVSALGWKDLRQRVTRTGPAPEIRLDVKLSTAAIALAAVAVEAQRTRPTRGGDATGGPGANDAAAGIGVNGLLSPDQMGDLDRMAATVPGVTGGPAGLSAFGLAGQTAYTLNGMAFDGGSLPRGMQTSTRVSMGTYDPSRGGFGAAEVAASLNPGNQYAGLRTSATVDARVLQASDGAASRLGHEYDGAQVSASGDGELVADRYYYNVGVQGVVRWSAAPSLFASDADLLRLSGVAADSAARLGGLLGAAGVPVAGAGADRTTRNVTLLGRLDRTPRGKHALSLTGYGSLSADDAGSAQPTATAGHARRTRSAQGQLQAAHSTYFGNEYLNEAQTAVSYRSDRGTPYLGLPEGRVRVASAFGDGSDAVASLAFGGGGAPTQRDSWRWETTDQVQLYTRASKHKIKLYAQSRLEGYTRAASEGAGTFTYNSLADVAANRPATFSRTLLSPGESGGEWSGAFAVADLWKARPFLQVMYGARLEANRFTTRPAANPAVEQAFGARTDHPPNTAHVSPRLGFTWTYAGSRAGGFGNRMGPLGAFQTAPRGVIRGGVGEFRNALRPDLLSRARTATGLPGGEQRLFCGGDAVPTPDWAAYAADPESIPAACAGASTPAFSDAAPGVELFAADYTAARSWRGNLGWSGGYGRFALGIDATYSLGLNQPGAVDLNFAGTPAFTLPLEGGRPVYAPASDIVAATGVVSPVGARASAAFGRVWEQRSDLRVRARQLTVTASPMLGWLYHLSASYTLADTREQQRGFDGGTFGDPRALAWSPGSYTPRHQVLAQGGFARKGVSFTFAARAYSGLPYTPVVGGDVNGDGLANDRAFVFDPAATADPALAHAMQVLIASAPGGAADCLRRQMGRAAERNSCRAPWSVSTNARLGFTPKLTHLPRRMNVSMNLANPLGGIDRLVHGADGLRGWGGTAVPDPTLLYVRGFDPAARAFRYDVNPRFGATAPALRTLREPFRLTLDVGVDLGTSFSVQQIRRALRPGRNGDHRPRLTAEALRERYSRDVTNVYSVILDMSDSLLLSPQQTQALKQADAVYRAGADSVWTGLATYLAALPDRYDAAEAVKRQEAAGGAVWALAWRQRPTVEGILTPLQMTMLPAMLTTFFREKEGTFRFFM